VLEGACGDRFSTTLKTIESSVIQFKKKILGLAIPKTFDIWAFPMIITPKTLF
jgi:hypothetical protein